MTTTHSPLLGFTPFLRKEITEWWQRRVAAVTFLVVAAFGTLGTMAGRIDQAGGGAPTPAMLDATFNVFGARLDQWVMMAGIFAGIGMLTQERATGTLAWTLSKPISRSSVLLAKWTAAVLMLTVFAVVLPLAWMVALSTLSYGNVPDLAAVARFGGVLIALPALFVALELGLATRIDNQAGIAAIAMAVAFAPYLLSAFLPSVAELWPSSITVVAAAVATGEPANLATVASWALTILAAGAAGLWIFNREDM
jgi:ABC-type transport system involved in multi-copper enzyme maturation permease subunit